EIEAEWVTQESLGTGSRFEKDHQSSRSKDSNLFGNTVHDVRQVANQEGADNRVELLVGEGQAQRVPRRPSEVRRRAAQHAKREIDSDHLSSRVGVADRPREAAGAGANIKDSVV